MRWILAIVVSAQCASALKAQPMIRTQVPLRGINDNFFERMGFGWGVRAPGFFLNLGSFQPAIPQFGGFQPGAGLQGGFGFRGGGLQGNGFFDFSQGSRRTFTTQAPSVTLSNGARGFISDSSLTPFVTGFIPVVGDGGPPVPVRRVVPWRIPLEMGVPLRPPGESAGRSLPRNDHSRKPKVDRIARHSLADDDPGRQSVAELRRGRQAAAESAQTEARKHLKRAEDAVAQGKSSVARIYFKMAARRAHGKLKEDILRRLASLPK